MKLFLILNFCVVFASAKEWWETAVFYQIYPLSFKDSNDDGNGDLKGIIQKIDHLQELGVDGIWMNPIFASPMKDNGYDISDYKSINQMFGNLTDFENLLKKAHELNIKVCLDFVPNHTSDQHFWFQQALKFNFKYLFYYIFREEENIPNNWQSVFNNYSSAWSRISSGTNRFYLHQFKREQPDLNFNHPDVQAELKSFLKYWLDLGVDGFRFDAVNFLHEDILAGDEKIIDPTVPLSYQNLNHTNTLNQKKSYEEVYEWRAYLDEYKRTTDNKTRVMMTEAYTDLDKTLLWYQKSADRKGAHIPFNFEMMTRLGNNSTATECKAIIDAWIEKMPKGEGLNPNWVMGNHDNKRLVTRFGRDRADGLAILQMSLPGIAFIYYGDEIGMEDHDAILSETIQDSRNPARTPLQWDATDNAGFTNNAKPWLPVHSNYKDINVVKQKTDEKSFLKLYQKLIRLRKKPAFVNGNYSSKLLKSNNVLAITRGHIGNETYITLVNFSPEKVELNLNEEFGILECTVIVGSLSYKIADDIKINPKNVELDKYEAVILQSGALKIKLSLLLVILFIALIVLLAY